MMHALLLAAALSTASPSPIRDSMERLTASPATGFQAGGVPGFEDVKKPKREKFFGPVNLLTGVVLGLSAAYDVKTTYDVRGLLGPNPVVLPDGTLFARHTFPQPNGSVKVVEITLREKNGFYRSSVIRGDRGATYRQKAYMNVPVWVGSHFLRRSRHWYLKVPGWVLPVLFGGLQVHAGIGNQREFDRIEPLLR